ncbi:MAG: hypothetical protein LQ352_004819 [Teloschistes flavicans]|nr:MAG: hypothetical protein LQ352_004819 [Teloschistes flavicans]
MPSSSKGFDGILDMTAARGYDIDFGTLQGQEHFAKPYTFISRVHTLGPGVPIEVEVREYLRMTEWDIAKGFGFLIIFARLSDIFCRKRALLSALTLFTVFSLACDVAQTMEQLYVFRASTSIIKISD